MYSVVTIAHSGKARVPSGAGSEVVFQRGTGGLVFDIENRQYIDFILGYGSVVLGHAGVSFLDRLQRYSHNGMLLPGYSIWHARLLERLVPSRTEDCAGAFFKTGSESVTAAIRLTSRLSSKKGVIRCGFIGWHDAELGGTVRWHESLNSPLRYKVRFLDGFRGISGDEGVFNWVSLDLDDLNRIVKEHANNIACFIIDTYQMRYAGEENIASAITLCRDHGIYVVADETKIAGRVSQYGFATDFSWDVDFRIVGKALANGAPLSVLLGRTELMAISEEARVTGTFSQEMTAVFSALATLDEIEQLDGYATLRFITPGVVSAFNTAAQRLRINDLVHAEALFGGEMFDLQFTEALLGDWRYRQELSAAIARQGVLVLQGHPSYVCCDHRVLNFDDLSKRFERGLADWTLFRDNST